MVTNAVRSLVTPATRWRRVVSPASARRIAGRMVVSRCATSTAPPQVDRGGGRDGQNAYTAFSFTLASRDASSLLPDGTRSDPTGHYAPLRRPQPSTRREAHGHAAPPSKRGWPTTQAWRLSRTGSTAHGSLAIGQGAEGQPGLVG
jgi:hypothetical protein